MTSQIQTPTVSSGTVGGISYDELLDSMEVDYSASSPRGRRSFLVAWTDRFNFAKEMCGELVYNVSGELVMNRRAKQFPGFPALRARSARVVGHGGANIADGEIYYDLARVEITYEILPYERPAGNGESETETTESMVIGSQELDFSAEILSMPEGGFKWSDFKYTYNSGTGKYAGAAGATDSGKVVTQQVGIFIPSIDRIYTKRDLAALPMADLRRCVGKVNDDAFQGAPTGCLLLAGAKSRRTISISTDPNAAPDGYELTLHFKERDFPWFCLWNSSDQCWVELSPRPYQSADFSRLLQFVAD